MLAFDWKPDKKSALAIHLQIAGFIRDKIAKGQWPVGSVIPAQRQMAEAFEVNRSTVVTALEELISEGLLLGCGRTGTKVINSTWSLLNSSVPPDWNGYISAGTHKPNVSTIQIINRLESAKGIIRLGTGELSPDLIPSGAMPKVAGRLAERMEPLGYLEGKGLPFLREAVCRYLKSFGIDMSPSGMMIVSGALQAFQLISVGILPKGSTVLIEKPSYLYSLKVFQSAGMFLESLPMDEDGLKIRELLQHKRKYEGSILYTIPTFHNPTGILMPDDRRNQLLAACETERLPVIEDDTYHDLWIEAPPPMPLKARDKSGLVLYVGSLSKSLCPGLRIGWMAGPEPVIERLADIKMQSDYGSSSISQWLAAEWLNSGMYLDNLAIVRGELRKRRDTALDLLDQYFRGLAEWNIPKGGYYIWMRFNDNVNTKQLFEEGLKKGILLNPGYIYDEKNNSNLRLSYSYASLDELARGIKILSELVQGK
jgi:Transcriptional regulators containing a DNA-binding HTH domain and an aminotransferase domain (MocR family) and their eukaryotic orthologs